jgi:hypothetical protein
MGDMADMIIDQAMLYEGHMEDAWDGWADNATCNKCGNAILFKDRKPIDFDGKPHRCPIVKSKSIPLMSEVFG